MSVTHEHLEALKVGKWLVDRGRIANGGVTRAFELRSEGRVEVSTTKEEVTVFHTEGTPVAQVLTSEQTQ